MVMTVEEITAAPVEIAPQEVSTPLKLSEALRLGAMVTRQVFGQIGDLKETTCAIGAVYKGFGFDGSDTGGQMLSKELNQINVKCPDNSVCSQGSLEGVIIHLNDQHHWPRENIATWLEGLGF